MPGELKAREASKSRNKTVPGRLRPFWRGLIEVAFIIFLFYSNLLMGEFTASGGKGKTLGFALRDMVTGKNLIIALVSALIGYLMFESLRRKL
jgi:hypothetical protein